MRDVNHQFKDFEKYFVGVDKIYDTLTSIAQQSTELIQKYPPYNIKKVDENRYVIEMAVAGFGKQDLELELIENKLTIKGKLALGEASEQSTDGAWTFPQVLYQGLAMRPFTRTFNLADNVEIQNDGLFNGILRIVLDSIIPEHKKPKKIQIADLHTETDNKTDLQFLKESK